MFFDFFEKFNTAKRALSVYLLLAISTGFAATDAFSRDMTGFQPGALDHAGIYDLRSSDPNLTGEGVTVAVVCRSITYLEGQPQNDYKLNIEHDCFAASNITLASKVSTSEGISEHSTAIGAILVGNDPNAYHRDLGYFKYEGAVSGTDLEIHEFWRFVCNHIFDGKILQADILTMSAGTTYEDWWTRGIEMIAEKDGTVVIASIGNGSDVFDPVLYPAAGSNVIGVGVVDSVDDSFSLPTSRHSSAGPTGDGRCKPDIVAPGNCIVPDAGNIDGYSVSGDGSSFATPVVAGAVSLLMQKAKQQPELNAAVQTEGGNCVIKAIILNSAAKLPYWHKGNAGGDDDHKAVLDHIQGAGMIDAQNAYRHLLAGQGATGTVKENGWDNNIIAADAEAENVYRIKIEPESDKYITATLAWNRHYEEDYPFRSIESDRDLRLELWAVDPNDGDNDYLMDYSDSLVDNLEHIYCPVDPNFSVYELVVAAGETEIEDTGENSSTERYGIAWDAAAADNSNDILMYDLNVDGKLDVDDLSVMLDLIGKPVEGEEGYLYGDINMDGAITQDDLTILMGQLSESDTN